MYPAKSSQSLLKQSLKENTDPCFSDEAYKKATVGNVVAPVLMNHDLPLQVKSLNTPQFS